MSSTAENENRSKIVAEERVVLRALCRGDLTRAQWEETEAQLAAYQWREPDHSIVFRALQRARATNQEIVEKHLAAHATRMGFPDIDWKDYLAGSGGCAPPRAKLVKAIENLLRVSHRPKGPS